MKNQPNKPTKSPKGVRTEPESTKYKIDSNFMVVLLQACQEAQIHQNDLGIDNEDISVPVEVLDFLNSIVQNHPEPQVRKFYMDEIERIRKENTS